MERSLFDLSPATRWVGQRLDIYSEIDSTNRVAEELAQSGAPEGTVVLADAQTAGRGRLGRSFHSPPGCSVYLSLILRPRSRPDRAHHHGFVAALAVAETAAAWLSPDVEVAIKWPNDVLLNGRKTSGINLPLQLDGDRVRWLVLGIGVNVNIATAEFPPELQAIATSLAEAGRKRLDRTRLTEALLERLEREIDAYRAGGFGQVLDAWQKYFKMRGSAVRIGGPGIAREVEGVVEGIDADGALLVRTKHARERVLAGDVTLLRPKG